MHQSLTALWNRVRPCTGTTIALGLAAGILLLDAAVALPDESLPIVAAVAVGLYVALSRWFGAEDGCCEGC